MTMHFYLNAKSCLLRWYSFGRVNFWETFIHTAFRNEFKKIYLFFGYSALMLFVNICQWEGIKQTLSPFNYSDLYCFLVVMSCQRCCTVCEVKCICYIPGYVFHFSTISLSGKIIDCFFFWDCCCAIFDLHWKSEWHSSWQEWIGSDHISRSNCNNLLSCTSRAPNPSFTRCCRNGLLFYFC